jgi:hypothetical protein
MSAPAPAPAPSASPRSPAPAPASPPTAGRALPSTRALALEARSRAELEAIFQRGVRPALADLAGWEFRGINAPSWARLLGIKKFIKGFAWRDQPGGELYGYNTPVTQNVLDGRWASRPDEAAPKRFGFYRVAPVDPTARDNAYLHALLLDYGAGGNPRTDPSRGLRDYLVQIDAGDPDLLLGKAYYAVGGARVPTNFFILERYRRGA